MSKPRRRGNGEGTAFQRAGSTRWEARGFITLPSGERKRVAATGATSAEARRRLAEKLARLDAGRPAVDSGATFAAWLTHWEAAILAVSDVRPGTRDVYARSARLHLVPLIGGVKLRDLRAHHLERVLLERAHLSGSSRRLILQTARQALDAAVRDGLIATNPAAQVARPKQTPVRETTWYSPAEVRRLLDAARGERLEAALVVAAYTGIRRGELLALRWSDIALEAGTIAITGTLSRDGTRTLVRSTPKTARSRRTLPLPEPVRAALVEHKRRQAVERLHVGPSWRDTDAVFPNELGGWLEPRTASRWFASIAEKAGVAGSWHALRHSAATTLLASGASARLVADMLGHASVQTTLGLYAHTGAEHLEDAAAKLTAALA